jgi:uncharacterized membrane protein
MILSMYIAMFGVAIWVLYFAERVSLAVGIIGMITACVCMAIANFKYQRMLDQLETLECELRKAEKDLFTHSVIFTERIMAIERKMEDDGK